MPPRHLHRPVRSTVALQGGFGPWQRKSPRLRLIGVPQLLHLGRSHRPGTLRPSREPPPAATRRELDSQEIPRGPPSPQDKRKSSRGRASIGFSLSRASTPVKNRRQTSGRWDEALTAFERTAVLNPTNNVRRVSSVDVWLRNDEEATDHDDHDLRTAPSLRSPTPCPLYHVIGEGYQVSFPGSVRVHYKQANRVTAKRIENDLRAVRRPPRTPVPRFHSDGSVSAELRKRHRRLTRSS